MSFFEGFVTGFATLGVLSGLAFWAIIATTKNNYYEG